MSENRIREEVANTMLALITGKLGVSANAETIKAGGKHRPDIIFQLRGVRVIIEGKFADTPNAKQIVQEDARKRVKAGISHIAVAVVYPTSIRKLELNKISDELVKSRLQYFVVAESFESNKWLEGNPTSLMEAIRRTHKTLVKDDIVERTAKSLSVHLVNISELWAAHSGVCDRLTKLLGITIPDNEKPKDQTERREMVAKVSALVLANAFIFQEQLSFSDERVDTLQKLKTSKNLIETTSSHWKWICKNINYVPIFQLAERIVIELPTGANTTKSIKMLLSEAQTICTEHAALRHDLMGRIYHWLLHYAKYLGTYYTSVSAATLLLKVTLNQKWGVDFGSPREIADFKVGDLACGTGTLLMASTQAITDNYIKSRLNTGKDIDDKDLAVLHSTLMQNIIHGYDILPSAVHLTASTLALLAPEVAFRQMNLFVMPMGLDHGKPRLGSLDFLDSEEVHVQFSIDNTHLDSVRTSASKSTAENAVVPKLDICVMNPPFVSNRYGNKMFGTLPDERAKLLKTLSTKSRKFKIGTKAGLGAVFVPLGDLYTKPGGRIAFVLPVALASGESWGCVRDYITQRYHLELVITSHDAKRWNFSENTSLSEILFVARKLKQEEKAGKTAFFSLWKNPTTIYGALDFADRISEALNGKLEESAVTSLKSGDDKIGEMTVITLPIGDHNWMSALFAQGQLFNIHRKLEQNSELFIPGSQSCHQLNLCRLEQLGEIGYDVRGIVDAFDVDRTQKDWSPYSGFWDHKADNVVQITQNPNATLIPRPESTRAKDIWEKSGRILIVSRLRTTTHRVIGVGFDKQVLGNTWWAFNDSQLNDSQRKSLLLWLNSTLGILSYYGRRAVTEGPWMQMKKPGWQNMPVLNVKVLSDKELTALEKAYDNLAVKKLNSISQLYKDPIRIKIDQALEQILNLPSLELLRELIAREPGITGTEIDAQN